MSAPQRLNTSPWGRSQLTFYESVASLAIEEVEIALILAIFLVLFPVIPANFFLAAINTPTLRALSVKPHIVRRIRDRNNTKRTGKQ